MNQNSSYGEAKAMPPSTLNCIGEQFNNNLLTFDDTLNVIEKLCDGLALGNPQTENAVKGTDIPTGKLANLQIMCNRFASLNERLRIVKVRLEETIA